MLYTKRQPSTVEQEALFILKFSPLFDKQTAKGQKACITHLVRLILKTGEK